MTKPSYDLFDRNTTSIVYGMQTAAIQRMLDFDHLCQRDTPSVAAIVNPTGEEGYHRAFFGKQEVLIPIYRTVAEAAHAHPAADVVVNFASFRSAFATTMEALAEPTIRTVGVIAEGVPERQARILAAKSRELGKVIIGPATVGGLGAGTFKIGNTGG
ncbi:MAG: ATP citrate synthase, partial [Chloroflexi bacterium]|nr:ATP citrate synthase [Chloroflexota bacterium]